MQTRKKKQRRRSFAFITSIVKNYFLPKTRHSHAAPQTQQNCLRRHVAWFCCPAVTLEKSLQQSKETTTTQQTGIQHLRTQRTKDQSTVLHVVLDDAAHRYKRQPSRRNNNLPARIAATSICVRSAMVEIWMYVCMYICMYCRSSIIQY